MERKSFGELTEKHSKEGLGFDGTVTRDARIRLNGGFYQSNENRQRTESNKRTLGLSFASAQEIWIM